MEYPVKIAGNQVDLRTLPFRKFRKRPVIISAVQIREHFVVETLEGTMVGEPGGWLVRGVEGEYYPITAGIFTATYEEVE